VRQNTWEAGLDRLLLGAAMAENESGYVGLALPLDDVDSTSIDLAGRLAELVDRLGAVLDALSGDQPLQQWLRALADALSALTSVGEADEWQLAQARRELAEVAEAAGEKADSVMLSLGDVRTLLAERLAGRPTRANFRTGNLTMCSMVPMRSVPHRVVCLLGVDDGIFPRTSGVDGDDVLARDPVVGERDRRSEDRQLLLDAVLAAQEHLVVLYTGADERTNTERPPAVPLGELLDVVDATVRGWTEAGHSSRSWCGIRFSRSTTATSCPEPSESTGRSASTGPGWPVRSPLPSRGSTRRSCRPAAAAGAGSGRARLVDPLSRASTARLPAPTAAGGPAR
jgi:exodeoxyribonuclease V gamma subunit